MDAIEAWGKAIRERNLMVTRTCMLRNRGSGTLHKPFALGDGRGCCNYEGISTSVSACGTSQPGGGYQVINFADDPRPQGHLCLWCFRKEKKCDNDSDNS